eukprot:comp5695_c0_seq1/m.1568 comp5695_c0_seq1/g.1568  ORF comp5695_c0_seq1/g.1568 comp5695_c0_seq1/m.1568 type:complete len:345 (-) comp5695_c0_seq1:863-1897(-)
MELAANNATDCPHGIPFIYTYFGECVDDPKHLTAFLIGLSSIGFWLFAQAPQMLTNWRLGNADSLSVYFLLQWLLGDTLNLIGALLTHQLATQVVTAYYFVGIDIVLMLQFIYYKLKRQHQHRQQLIQDKHITQLGCVGLLLTAGMCTIAATHTPALLGNGDFGVVSAPQRVLLAENRHYTLWNNRSEMIGYIIGIMSAILYLCSRVPQIVKNCRRQSTGGLAFTMFMLAVMGNVSYSVSIFLTSSDPEFLLRKLPWIVGSMGTLIFDFTIFSQFYMYGDNTKREGEQLHKVRVRSIDENAPLLRAGPPPGTVIRPLDPNYDASEHQPISPLIFPAAQKQNYYV